MWGLHHSYDMICEMHNELLLQQWLGGRRGKSAGIAQCQRLMLDRQGQLQKSFTPTYYWTLSVRQSVGRSVGSYVCWLVGSVIIF